MHRDSTGVVQRIEPGAINWMTAGRGIVHSERTPEDLRGAARRSHGLQLWAALPEADEEARAVVRAHAGARSRLTEIGGVPVRVLIGSAFGRRVAGADAVADAVPRLALARRRARCRCRRRPRSARSTCVDGACALDGERVPAHTMAVLAARRASRAVGARAAHALSC